MKNIWLILIIKFIFPIQGQSQFDNNWIIGIDRSSSNEFPMIVDFNSGFPITKKIDGKDINFFLFSNSISNEFGQLLFYTNGLKIFNRDNEIMENGDTIISQENYDYWNAIANLGSPGISGYIIPAPGLDQIYYLFYSDFHYEPDLYRYYFRSPLYLCVIDMEENQGLGKVVLKKQIILDGALSHFGLVKHANGRDWWVVVPELNSDVFYNYLITPQGILGPQIFYSGFTQNEFYATGRNKFSPNGELFIRNYHQWGTTIYNFDRCSGKITYKNSLFYKDGNEHFDFDIECSPNNRYLYISEFYTLSLGSSKGGNTRIWQYDLNVEDIERTGVIAAQSDLHFAILPNLLTRMQLSPLNNIFVSSKDEANVFSYIERPDLPAPYCNVSQHNFQLPSSNLATAPRFPNYKLKKIFGSPCDTIQFQNIEEIADLDKTTNFDSIKLIKLNMDLLKNSYLYKCNFTRLSGTPMAKDIESLKFYIKYIEQNNRIK
ncbi:MAG: hypothetical protein V9E90_11550 [Saprospiraceae bacterium]